MMEKIMKKIVLALAGASVALTGLAAAPASAAEFGRRDRGRVEQVQTRDFQQTRNFVQDRNFAQNRNFEHSRNYTGNRFVMNNRFQGRNWQRGERFDRSYATNYMVISDPHDYNLQQAPYGYRWVRSGNDAVLIAIASGIIGALVGNAF
jgi:Ni/Co efflux regulator RcnB